MARTFDSRYRIPAALILAALTLPALVLSAPGPAAAQEEAYTRADTLRGSIGPGRDWWDVTFYDLRVQVEPADSTIAGTVGIVYRITGPGDTLQIDLQQPLEVEKVTWRGRRLAHRREGDVVWVEAPQERPEGAVDTVVVRYGGKPRAAANPPWDGGVTWERDERGRPYVATAVQGLGASAWWPNKDTQAEEPDSQRIAVTVPDSLVNVSNGRLRAVRNHDDGTTTFEWFVTAPINNYGVAVNAAHYAHFGDVFHGEGGELTLDYWPLEAHLERARGQFAQTPSVLRCFEGWFGPYPWYVDGFKMVETPFLGMEHQSAVAYGNEYQNGYLGRDLSGTGLGLEWDYIIVHEIAHEWWGNSVTTADIADLWVHEGFASYAEGLYVECLQGADAGARYIRGTRGQVAHEGSIIGPYGVNAEGSGDMYFKGANMLHTIRRVVGDDERWRETLRGLQAEFRHEVVTGDRVRRYLDQALEPELEPVFRQYLTTPDLPVLEVREAEGRDGGSGGAVEYRWAEVVDGFRMPVDVRLEEGAACRRLRPTEEWQAVEADAAAVEVDRDFYVRVRRMGEEEGSMAAGVCG